jgi:histidinol-phosphatase (PHP family)
MKDYHNHTFRCNHATGDVEDYCRVALERNITVLGISDHTPLPDDKWLFRRMKHETLDDYVFAIKKARVRYPELTLLASMECDYLAEYELFFREELLGRHGLQYLIGAVHWYPTKDGWVEVPDGNCERDHIVAYTKQYLRAMNNRDFLFMAHPDIFGCFYPSWDVETETCSKEILAAARDLNVVLELNSHGLRKSKIKTDKGECNKYPILQFWEMVPDYDVQVVINSDAHHPEHIGVGTDKCYEIARQLNLKIVDFSFLEGTTRSPD